MRTTAAARPEFWYAVPLCALQASWVRARGSDGRRAVWRQRKNFWPASAGRSGRRGERAGAKKVHLVHPDYGREVVAPRPRRQTTLGASRDEGLHGCSCGLNAV